MGTAVFCTVKNPAHAAGIIDQLRLAGFTSKDISVLMSEGPGTREFIVQNQTKAPEGAVTGAGTGALLGGALGWLTGIGALAIPGLGPFIAAGPILAALGGVAIGGTVGGLTGSLIGMGIPEYEAILYEGRIKSGSVLISVHSETSDQTKRAKLIFEGDGAEDISSSSEVIVATSNS